MYSRAHHLLSVSEYDYLVPEIFFISDATSHSELDLATIPTPGAR